MKHFPMDVETLPELLGRYHTNAIARELHVHPDTVRNWKTGAGRPALEHLEPLARFLNIDLEFAAGLRARLESICCLRAQTAASGNTRRYTAIPRSSARVLRC
jgi:hypothetical protein